MLVLVTYDINTETAKGRRRLYKIAKLCTNFGQRVQNSVFECLLDSSQCKHLQSAVCEIINENEDSVRFYYLGNRYEDKIKDFGCKKPYMPHDNFII